MAEYGISSSKRLKWLKHLRDIYSAASELVWEVTGGLTALAIHIAKPAGWEGAKGASMKRGQESWAGAFEQPSQWKHLAPSRVWEG